MDAIKKGVVVRALVWLLMFFGMISLLQKYSSSEKLELRQYQKMCKKLSGVYRTASIQQKAQTITIYCNGEKND